MQNAYEALKAPSAGIMSATTSVSAEKEVKERPQSGATWPPLCCYYSLGGDNADGPLSPVGPCEWTK